MKKTKLIIVVVAIILVTTTVFVTKYLTEKKCTDVNTLPKAKIELKNKALQKVIDEYVNVLQFKTKHYIIKLNFWLSGDTINIEIGPSCKAIAIVYVLPPSAYASYKNIGLLIYNGSEQYFSFSNQYKDELAKLFFPDQVDLYKKTGFGKYTGYDERLVWFVQIKQNKIIKIQKNYIKYM